MVEDAVALAEIDNRCSAQEPMVTVEARGGIGEEPICCAFSPDREPLPAPER
jgi:hypothetical protein